MSKFIANNARKVFEQMYFDKMDNKKGKEPKNKGGDSIWDTITEKAPDNEPKK